MHPSEEIKGVKSNILKNKKIVLAVTGSIAAIESIKLARELIRHDAEIIPVMTKASTQIIHPDALWFATGKKPKTTLTGQTEHVSYCGKIQDSADLLLISPCTANTISKIAHGIDDTSVTTFATTAIGSKTPILIVPAMHLSMYSHNIIKENIEKCKQNQIEFISPHIKGSKAKLASIDEIVANVIKKTNKNDLNEKKMLIIGGSNIQPIDDIRYISNFSSGKTGLFLAKKAYLRGAKVLLMMGHNNLEIPKYIKTRNFTTIKKLTKLLKEENLSNFDIIINCAAISDYIPEKTKGKIKSGKKNLKIKMNNAPKIIPKIKKMSSKSTIVAFKAEEKKENIEKKSMELLKKYDIDYVVGNHISAFNKDQNEISIFDRQGKIDTKKDRKEKLADHILDKIK
ncbi:MAG: bifunctional phosphopantothenoylcysteine decarboxylase/phosphopantothenate--cysteine ligase CoaBC [Candidatus Thermoplasmatota archaeon]